MSWKVPVRAKVAVAELACRPSIGRWIARRYGDRIPSGDCVIDTRNPRITPEIKASLYWGLYESAELRFIARWLPADADVLELGSSIGVIGSHVAKKLEPGRRLVCVEANPNLLDTLRANLAANAAAIRTTVVHGALDYSGAPEVTFAIARSNIASSVGGPSGEHVEVPALTLGGLVAAHALDRFTLVSDIEGAELAMLRDDDALSRCDRVLIELHDTTSRGVHVPIEQVVEITLARGFELLDRHGPVCVFQRT